VEEYFVHVGIFLDTQLKRFEKHKCFEHLISLSAGIAEEFCAHDYVVDLYVSGEHPQYCQYGRKAEPFHMLLEMLSSIEGDKQIPFDLSLAQIKEHAIGLSMLVVLLKDWDEERSGFVRQCREAGLEVYPIVVRDKPLSLSKDRDGLQVYSTRQLKEKDA